MTVTQESIVVDPSHRGLPEIAHGGYVAGVMAEALGSASAEVRLRRPVPIGHALSLERSGADVVELRDGPVLLAEASAAEVALEVPAAVTLAEAEAASRAFPGFDGHLFPGCLACGTRRGPGDGLRIFPGAVSGRRLVAAPWVPAPEHADDAGHVRTALAWAALDCPQIWSLILHVAPTMRDVVVTASLAASTRRPVVAGEPHLVIGWPIGRDGRGWLAGAAILGPDGAPCVVGRQRAAIAGWGVPLGRAHWPIAGA